MDRQAHLIWAKKRALEYTQQRDYVQAFSSLLSDLSKHEDLRDAHQLCRDMGGRLLMGGHLNSTQKMTEWIEGFN